VQSKKYTNVFKHDKNHSGIIGIHTEPQVAIGQRAFLLCSDEGNILWDCITYIDDDTVRRIKDLGGIHAIVISHPHYFSTSLHWAEAFGCKVYISSEDAEWVMRRGDGHVFFEEQTLDFLDGTFKAVKVGGHFPGSSVLHWKSEKKLFIADSIMAVPSGTYHVDRPPNTASFTFMWSYPNMVNIDQP
jgi:glyoxylase-like metal-dependent hydrolase (beta-lactamase superfamily II)